MKKIFFFFIIFINISSYSQDFTCIDIKILEDNTIFSPDLLNVNNNVICYSFYKKNKICGYVFYKPKNLENNLWKKDSVIIPINYPLNSRLALRVTTSLNDDDNKIWFGTGSYLKGINLNWRNCYYCENDNFDEYAALYSYKDNKLEYYALPKVNQQYDRYDSNYHYINKIAIDKYKNIWILANYLFKYDESQTIGNIYSDSVHLLKFDGKNWKLFDKKFLGFKKNFEIYDIATDKKGNIWVACDTGLFCINNDTIKTIFTRNNSPLKSNYVKSLCLDNNDKLWFQLYKPLNNDYSHSFIGNFDGIKWSYINDSLYTNTNLKEDNIVIKFDKKNILWITGRFIDTILHKVYCLAKYNSQQVNYKIYNSQCMLGCDHSKRIFIRMEIDKYDNFWLQDTYQEDLPLKINLTLFNENGIVIDITKQKSNNFNLLQISPNPFTDRIQISIDRADSKSSLYQIAVYDLTGRKIKSFNYKDIPQTGNFAIECPDLPCGIYIIRLQTDKAVYAGKLIKE